MKTTFKAMSIVGIVLYCIVAVVAIIGIASWLKANSNSATTVNISKDYFFVLITGIVGIVSGACGMVKNYGVSWKSSIVLVVFNIISLILPTVISVSIIGLAFSAAYCVIALKLDNKLKPAHS